MQKVTINCVHCGKAFQANFPAGTGQGSFAAQHTGVAGACGKSTRVYYNKGQVVRTDTK